MYRKKLLLSFFSIMITAAVTAQDDATILEYIANYKELAIAEMQRTGIPASIKLAQGIHETAAGTSNLVLKSNNHFGLKCKTEWKGMSVKHTDDAPNECFRKYEKPEDSYRDQSNYLKNSPRYASLFALDPLDYKGWATGLKKAGYATNPKYAPVLIRLIENYHLQDYTLIGLGKLKQSDIAAAEKNNPPVKQTEIIPAAQISTAPEKETEAIVVAPEPVKEPELPLYPDGVFKINETKVLFVKKGTSFLSVANQYNIALGRLFDFNDMQQKEESEKDQLIYLMPKRKTGNEEFHIVQPGETLHDIAQRQAIRIESLLEYNLLSSAAQKPATGEKLFLKSKAAAAPRLALKENVSLDNIPVTAIVKPALSNSNPEAITGTGAKNGSWMQHTIAPKETIYSIAKKYNVKIDDIVKWNNLAGYDLKTGQQLKIHKL